jgi:hypothetical protein
MLVEHIDFSRIADSAVVLLRVGSAISAHGAEGVISFLKARAEEAGKPNIGFLLIPSEPAPQVSIAPQTEFWGVYCPQHDVWACAYNGEYIYYPSEEIAAAHARGMRGTGSHLWAAIEFGRQPLVPPALNLGDVLCPAGDFTS